MVQRCVQMYASVTVQDTMEVPITQWLLHLPFSLRLDHLAPELNTTGAVSARWKLRYRGLRINKPVKHYHSQEHRLPTRYQGCCLWLRGA